MSAQNDFVAISRRSALKTGLAGIAVLGTGLLGASHAFAEEGGDTGAQAASQDLTTLSDDELLALEAAVRAEKVRRQINTAVVPKGTYTAGVDFAPGTYTIRTIFNEENGSDWVTTRDDSGEQIDFTVLDKGEMLKLTLSQGYTISISSVNTADGMVAISPFSIDFGMSTDAATPEEPATESDPAPTDASSDSVTPEFKEMMDGYETFMNSYCDFMVKYTDASNSGDTMTLLSMTSDYTSLIQQEIDWVGKINAVDQSTLSAADAAYYVEVQGRVSQKLIDTGVSLS